MATLSHPPYLSCGAYQLALKRPLVMGIVNVTPDSFSDGGRFIQLDVAIAHAKQLVLEGADILDIGGESTRPGATPVSLDEELRRVIPVIEGLRDIGVPLSIDTYKPAVMQAAIKAGVSIVNDVRALQEPNALEIVASSNVGVCLMHMQGTPQAMQVAPQYAHVVQEVMVFLAARREAAMRAGIAAERIMLDPGFGFGKRVEDNIQLIQQLETLQGLGQPLLVGLSRKSILGAITGNGAGADAAQKLYAGIAASVISVMKGAKIVRVHDVKATVDAFKVLHAIQPA